jgi:hypothetical protein
MGVHVIGIGKPILQGNALEGEDVIPGGFSLQEGGVEDEAAKIVQGSN